jgi:molecular chaperone DnaK (HSP70)
MAIRLGIDFGTTRTVVAAQDNGNYPVYTFSWQGEAKEYIPTLVGVKDGILLFGWDAACLLSQPGAFILRSMKRLADQLRPEDPVDLGPDCSIALLEVVTLFLNHVRQMILEHGNIPMEKMDALEVMVATPANANTDQRYLTLEGFRRAGFAVLGVMDEPWAAAVEFLHRYLRDLGPISSKQHVAVYDLGGGTFDTSVVRIADWGRDVIAHESIGKLGGDDFDEIILSLALEQIGVALETLPPSDRARLLEECRERKEGLKSNTKKMVVDLGRVLKDQKPVILDTGIVYERCGPLIERSLKTLQSLLERITQNPGQSESLAAVYLVGGSVSFPPVARKLREIYRSKVKVSPLPHASTAMGLSIAGDPKANIKVREWVSRHFGSWPVTGNDKAFDPIFDKDQQADSDTDVLWVTRTYHPVNNIRLLPNPEGSSLGKEKEPEENIASKGETVLLGQKSEGVPHGHLDPFEERPAEIEVKIRKTGKSKRKRIRWHRSPSAEVSNYRLYWSIGEAVGYDSQYMELGGDVTEAILPDDIPFFPLISGTLHLGITALSNARNESDMTKTSAPFDFLVP